MDRAKSVWIIPEGKWDRRELRRGGDWWWETFSETWLESSCWFFTMDSGATARARRRRAPGRSIARKIKKTSHSPRHWNMQTSGVDVSDKLVNKRRIHRNTAHGCRRQTNYGLYGINSCCMSAASLRSFVCIQVRGIFAEFRSFTSVSSTSRFHSWIANKLEASTTKLKLARKRTRTVHSPIAHSFGLRSHEWTRDSFTWSFMRSFKQKSRQTNVDTDAGRNQEKRWCNGIIREGRDASP